MIIFGNIKIRQNKTKINAAKLHKILKYFTDCFIIATTGLSYSLTDTNGSIHIRSLKEV